MTPREDCIFCGIVGGKVPGRIVYEDDRTIAFLDIFPLTRGHTLVIPRRHSVNLLDARTEDVVAVALTAQHVARLASERLGADGVNLLQATGTVAFQTVMHFHMHVLPATSATASSCRSSARRASTPTSTTWPSA